MKLRPLIISNIARADIKRVRDYAEAHKISLHTILELMGKPDRAIGDDPGHLCVIPLGYRVAFSIEQQAKGFYRHVSISVDGDGIAPSVAAVNMICKEFGFTCHIEEPPEANLNNPNRPDMVYTEQLQGNKKIAINVLQKLDEKKTI